VISEEKYLGKFKVKKAQHADGNSDGYESPIEAGKPDAVNDESIFQRKIDVRRLISFIGCLLVVLQASFSHQQALETGRKLCQSEDNVDCSCNEGVDGHKESDLVS